MNTTVKITFSRSPDLLSLLWFFTINNGTWIIFGRVRLKEFNANLYLASMARTLGFQTPLPERSRSSITEETHAYKRSETDLGEIDSPAADDMKSDYLNC